MIVSNKFIKKFFIKFPLIFILNKMKKRLQASLLLQLNYSNIGIGFHPYG